MYINNLIFHSYRFGLPQNGPFSTSSSYDGALGDRVVVLWLRYITVTAHSCDVSFNSLSQKKKRILIYLLYLTLILNNRYIGRRIIRSGETTGDDLLPHVVDWISAAFGVYIGLISPMTTKVAVLGLVASVIALATHSLFLIVYWRYSAPDDRVSSNILYSYFIIIQI